MNTVYLDEQFRNPGVDHFDQYRDSCFYNLITKSIKERGNAYEEIAVKMLKSVGFDAELAEKSYGAYDLIVDGKKIELKASRKASKYDSRKRSYQFTAIRNNGDIDGIMLMIIQPDDQVKIYLTDFDRLNASPKLGTMHKDKNGNAVVWTLAAHPDEVDAEMICSVQFK